MSLEWKERRALKRRGNASGTWLLGESFGRRGSTERGGRRVSDPSFLSESNSVCPSTGVKGQRTPGRERFCGCFAGFVLGGGGCLLLNLKSPDVSPHPPWGYGPCLAAEASLEGRPSVPSATSLWPEPLVFSWWGVFSAPISLYRVTLDTRFLVDLPLRVFYLETNEC